MRLKRISLIAILLLTIVSGCSANRRGYAPLHESRERVSVPMRHADEYEPSVDPTDSAPGEQELLPEQHPIDGPTSDPPAVPSIEPPPAPPALGVSRVKSVGWLRDLGQRKHSADDCGDECAVGSFTPLDSCGASSTQCETAPSHGPVFLGGMRKGLSRMFHRDEPCGDVKCGSVFSDDRCVPRSLMVEEPCAEPGCGDNPENELLGRCTPLMHSAPRRSAKAPCFQSDQPAQTKPGCLADPLQEPFTDGGTVPSVSPFDAPESESFEPTPVEPPAVVPALPDGVTIPQSTGIVNPPAWPRRALSAPGVSHQQHPTTMKPAPASALPAITPRSANMPANALPQIMPGRRL